MNTSFPFEIWALIAKYAVRRPWTMNMFNPSVDDFNCVSGFAKASPVFKAIVNSLKTNNDILVVRRLEDLPDYDAIYCQRVKHLEIKETGDPLTERQLRTKISKFPQLTSLSIKLLYGENPFIALANDIQNLSQSATLHRIDIQYNIMRYEEQLEAAPRGELLQFHSLTELRFFNSLHSTVNIDETLVSGIADILFGVPRLELLSFNIHLLSRSTLQNQIRAHLFSNHGFGRSLSVMNCSECASNCDLKIEARIKEISATQVLAEKFPSLAEVRWAKWWALDQDENGQRRTMINRERGQIVLSQAEVLEID